MTKKNFDRRQAYLRALGHIAPHAKDDPDWVQRVNLALEAKGYSGSCDPHDPVYLARERAIWRILQRLPYWEAAGHNKEQAMKLATDESNELWREDLAICGAFYKEAAA